MRIALFYLFLVFLVVGGPSCAEGGSTVGQAAATQCVLDSSGRFEIVLFPGMSHEYRNLQRVEEGSRGNGSPLRCRPRRRRRALIRAFRIRRRRPARCWSTSLTSGYITTPSAGCTTAWPCCRPLIRPIVTAITGPSRNSPSK